MNWEFDHDDLTTDQWEVLKALRLPVGKRRHLVRFIVDRLVTLELATRIDDHPVLAEHGRKALIRGSCRLWDVAA